MHQALHHLDVPTRERGLTEITGTVVDWLAGEAGGTGLRTLFCRHPTSSLLGQENADPNVRADLEAFFETIAPEDPGRYVHGLEGPDDMPAHLRAALTQVSLTIPVAEGRMVLGQWQGIYLFEHRRAPHLRSIVLHLIGE